MQYVTLLVQRDEWGAPLGKRRSTKDPQVEIRRVTWYFGSRLSYYYFSGPPINPSILWWITQPPTHIFIIILLKSTACTWPCLLDQMETWDGKRMSRRESGYFFLWEKRIGELHGKNDKESLRERVNWEEWEFVCCKLEDSIKHPSSARICLNTTTTFFSRQTEWECHPLLFYCSSRIVFLECRTNMCVRLSNLLLVLKVIIGRANRAKELFRLINY